MALHRRLLQDIAELQSDPYPNIVLCVQDDNLQQACLLLTPIGKAPLHLTMMFGKEYPLKPPVVSIQTHVEHPNVFDNYICADILNVTESYTPAYTLKSIAIQLLSFFSSERIEQKGGYWIELDGYRHSVFHSRHGTEINYKCLDCGFGGRETSHRGIVNVGGKLIPDPFAGDRPHATAAESANASNPRDARVMDTDTQNQANGQLRTIDRILALSDEILLLIFGELDTKDLVAAAKVESRIEKFINSYDTIRLRELQCFCLKESFMRTNLGVGVHVAGWGRQKELESEFDLLSQQAFKQFRIRRSIQGLGFEYWLPLSLSRRHWRSASADVRTSLSKLAQAASIPNDSGYNIEVIYNFMTSVVAKLSKEAEKTWGAPIISTLTHASEKAVDSYFSLFHLLLCLATEQDQIVRNVNHRVQSFLAGHTSKEACPNLGQFLVAILISDHGLTQGLIFAIIKEAILRNVVWMLDKKGKGMAELSYLEPSAVSEYRLQRTFEASKVSYRLLMFQALFYRTARAASGKPISAIRDELFDAHGAPPKGTAETLAAQIRKIRTVNTWPAFFEVMGLEQKPDQEDFCAFLKRTIEDSVKAGYSKMPLSQGQALALRRLKEPDVDVAEGVVASKNLPLRAGLSFFPGNQGNRRKRARGSF